MREQGSRSPVEWFAHACLLVLVGVVALCLALKLLAQIWPWLLLIGIAVAGLWVGVAVWRSSRQQW